MDEARRYYANIVGKYGQQVQALFKKAESLTIDMICPLHGFVWRKYINEVMRPYTNWSRYEPEEQGVMIAYASVYGNTENAAEILACRLRDAKIKTVMYDVSVTPASNIVAACFKWSHLVFASTTYNAGIFVTMESLIYDLVAHNIQNRTVAFIENGSWATASGKLMRSELESCKNMTFLDTISLTSSVSADNQQELCNLAKTVADTFVLKKTDSPGHTGMNADALWKVPYGLFLVTAQDGDFDNGCIINTAEQITALPVRMTVSIDKSSLTHDMILKTNKLAVSVLTKAVPYYLLQHFGFNSGKNVNKFDLSESSPLYGKFTRLSSGLYGLTKYANAIFEGTVISSTDCASHTLFFIEIDAAHVISDEPSCTYEYYLGHIKPMPKPPEEGVSGYICKICGYIHEGEELPDDIICPICKHGAIDFEKL
jgi:flavin reductase (DIM6/NTAB) family NADH-FMN oxidoreductase RutF/flavodoxin/rubredoxin